MHAAAELVPGAHVAKPHAHALRKAAAAVSALLDAHVEVDQAVVVDASAAEVVAAGLEVADGERQSQDAQTHGARAVPDKFNPVLFAFFKKSTNQTKSNVAYT